MGHALVRDGVAIAGFMLVVWGLSVAAKDASLVDIAWGLGFAMVAWVGERHGIVVPVLTTIWGVRLAGYLAWRNLGSGEDRRYRAMRRRIGAGFWWKSFFIVFAVQGALMWIVSLPVQVPRAGWLGGIAVWAAGMLFETVGDLQLARFKADPANRGRVMDRGLWRYTRHPNYFGDFLVWWGLYLVSGNWWTAVGPVVMTLLLTRGSGAALLEKTIVNRRPEYADYIRRTSGFFPVPPRR